MSRYLDALIFDRTAEDVQRLAEKAYIDYADLNRVEAAIKWVSLMLNEYGYRNVTRNKLNWRPDDRRTEKDMLRIKKNLVAIRRAYYTPDSTPQTPERITYTSVYQANFIEKIIYDIGTLVESSFPGQPRLEMGLGKKMIGDRSV